ncbi:hypothetical protein [Christiangramia sabulilitoris]|uniref:Uncharacterized protein n=1 Tax=Christiangramia sabulilitoris TaxID=2583991 RepID=A0A550I7J1_9FLAO|nr:hypothetical protein [Christiangramia sabulilitoris]TRO66942.1 hypothetical protein FGM01_03365 [Christiangramia sabulilitoris]
MKRIVVLLTIILLAVSCSKDESSSKSNDSINPPEWIHGTWRAEDGYGSTTLTGLKFTSDDLILDMGSSELSHKAQLQQYSQISEITVDEEISNSEYSLRIDYVQGISINYAFNRIDEITIYWTSTGYGNLELKKQ